MSLSRSVLLQVTRPIPGRYASRWAPKSSAVAVLRYNPTVVRRQHVGLTSAITSGYDQNAHTSRKILHAPLNTRRYLSSTKPPNTSHPSPNSQNKANANTTEPPQEESTKPPYAPPTTGLIAHLPASLIPFAELSRLSAPAGTLYLLAPCVFSTLLAASVLHPVAAVPPLTVLSTLSLFALGATTMRGAGCTINDLYDRNLDARVARTRLRPLARRAVSPPAAAAWAALQCLAGLAILIHFPPQAIAAAIPSLFLVATYPLAKRVTSYPQLVLGLTFSWGALLGLPALGADLFPTLTQQLAAASTQGGLGFLADASTLPFALTPPDGALPATACLYLSCVLWTLLYDTIYAFQDIRDDARAGILSSARAQAAHPKRFLALLASAQVAMLGAVGVCAGLGPVYFAGTCGGAAASLGWMVWRVRLGDVRDCGAWFRRGAWFTGGGIGLGFLAEWVVRVWGAEEEQEEEG